MRVTYIAAGAAGMICGSCLRDNALARELRRAGCDVTFVPVYTPITTDVEDNSDDALLFGGVSVYLEQQSSIFRRLPKFVTRWLDNPKFVRWITSKRSLEVEAAQLGELTLSMLRGEHGNQAAEVARAVEWMKSDARPDLVNLTNLLIAGFVPAFKAALPGVPVLATLQGDDLFLDELTGEHRPLVLAELRRLAGEVDGFVTFSEAYANHMAQLLEVPREKFHLVPLGIDAREFAGLERAPGRPPTVGYFGRICPEKGFGNLVDAFIHLHANGGPRELHLKAGGWLGDGDRRFFDKQVAKIGDAGLTSKFDYIGAPDRAGKLAFFGGIDVFSLPTTYAEPKGLSVLEALASGIPVVQPAHGIFPELLGETGGGELVAPDDITALATAIARLIDAPGEAKRLGAEGRRAVIEGRSDRRMAEATLAIYKELRVQTAPGTT